MRAVAIEVHVKEQQWVEIGQVKPGDRPGSVTDLSGGDRTLLLFGWFLLTKTAEQDLTERPLVVLTRAEVELTQGDLRLIGAKDIEVLADLAEGPYQRTILSNDPICVRWFLV